MLQYGCQITAPNPCLSLGFHHLLIAEFELAGAADVTAPPEPRQRGWLFSVGAAYFFAACCGVIHAADL
jgi:hypothetical protein